LKTQKIVANGIKSETCKQRNMHIVSRKNIRNWKN